MKPSVGLLIYKETQIPCRMIMTNHSGATIEADLPPDAPKQLMLRFDEKLLLCRVAWRHGDRIGLKIL
jgi:hypothetical protein